MIYTSLRRIISGHACTRAVRELMEQFNTAYMDDMMPITMIVEVLPFFDITFMYHVLMTQQHMHDGTNTLNTMLLQGDIGDFDKLRVAIYESVTKLDYDGESIQTQCARVLQVCYNISPEETKELFVSAVKNAFQGQEGQIYEDIAGF